MQSGDDPPQSLGEHEEHGQVQQDPERGQMDAVKGQHYGEKDSHPNQVVDQV